MKCQHSITICSFNNYKMKFLVMFVSLASAFAVEDVHQPLYKYRYQTQDLMKSSSSDLPVHGYHFAEGGYYPENYRFDRFGPSRFDEFGGRYHQEPYVGMPYYRDTISHGRYYPHGGLGGGYVDKNVYNRENKNAGGERYEKAHGDKGVSAEHGSEGFSKGEVALKDAKGDSGFYKDEEGAKKAFDDTKSYQGDQHFNKEGENAENKNQNANHKKGHSTKGFKTFHHKDEEGKTETFYDEANDEGGDYKYDGHQDSFGENGQSNYRGGHENGQFEADAKRKQGHYDSHRIVDNANADKGAYDQKGYHGSGEVYRINNGVGQQSLLGRQEANREYIQHHPHGYIPFNPGY